MNRFIGAMKKKDEMILPQARSLFQRHREEVLT